MEEKKKKIIAKMIKYTSLLYVLISIGIIIYRAIFAVIEGDALYENIMLNFRSLFLAIIDTKEYFMVARIESISFLAIPISIFFALFFNYFLEKKGIFAVFFLGIVIFAICRLRFPFCMQIGMILCLPLYYILNIILSKKILHFTIK